MSEFNTMVATRMSSFDIMEYENEKSVLCTRPYASSPLRRYFGYDASRRRDAEHGHPTIGISHFSARVCVSAIMVGFTFRSRQRHLYTTSSNVLLLLLLLMLSAKSRGRRRSYHFSAFDKPYQ